MKKIKILIVDDNPANLKLAGDLLEIEGFEVCRCVDAETAVHALDNFHPDLILMDISLPGIDGLSLTRKLKSENKTKDIKIIALTAFAMKDDKEKVLAAGCDGYISKPIDTRKFKDQINEFLESGEPTVYKILIADDNPTSLKLLKGIYESEGYEVITAENGLRALDILLAQKIDLLVTDVLMPEMDGYYLCYKIRSNPQLKDIPIIVYTATYTSKSEESIAKEMGADMFIRKPAPIKELINSTRKILSGPYVFDRDIIAPQRSTEAMHQYSSDLINKLEQRNIELEKIKDSLEVTLARFKQAQQIANLGYWELDLATKKAMWSSEVFHILGMEQSSGPLSVDGYLNFVHPEDLEYANQIIQNSLKTFTVYSFYHRIIQPDGRIKHLFVVGEYEFDKLNYPSKLFGIILDVTELTLKKEKLNEANKELETFIYKSSHDLRGPIASLLGLVDVAKMEITDPLTTQYLDAFDEIGLKLNTIMAKLIQIMSIKNKIAIPQIIDMKKLVTEALSLLNDNDGYEKIKFVTNVQLDAPIITDKEVLSNILSNLIDNSIKYQKIAKDSGEIGIHVFSDERRNIIIEVSDNGIGISEQAIDKIFNMFYRGTQKSKGSGLGLYYVKNALEVLDGTIYVSSKEGSGSVFRIKIPQLTLSDIN